MDLKDQREVVKLTAIDQVKTLQKKKKLTRLEFVRLLNKKGYTLSIQAYYDLLGGRLSTDATINNATKILELCGKN